MLVKHVSVLRAVGVLEVLGGDEAMRFLDVYSDIDDGLRKSDPERYVNELLAQVGKCWR